MRHLHASIAATIVALCASACLQSPSFDCAQNGATSCGDGATCESSGYCSQNDDSCDGTGRRYGDNAAELSGQCVPVETADPDAGPDASPDASPDSGTALSGPRCVVSGALGQPLTGCERAVCDQVPSCCDAMWTHECVRMVETVCDYQCATAVATAGYGSVVAGHHGDDAWVSRFAITGGADYVETMDWADYDGDGDADLAYVDDCKLRVVRNDGGTGAIARTQVHDETLSVCIEPRLIWADVDDDGDLDIVMGTDAGLHLVRNDGGDTFTPLPDLLDQGFDVSSLSAADYDGDGDIDIAVGLYNQSSRLLRQEPAGLTLDAGWMGPDQVWDVQWCHLRPTDERPALVVVANGRLYLYPNSGGPAAAATIDLGLETNRFLDAACGDLDGDGVAELVTVSTEFDPVTFAPLPGHVRLHSLSDGSTLWTSPTAYLSGHIDIGDVDGDGRLDIVSEITGESFRLYRQTTAPTLGFADDEGTDWLDGIDTSNIQTVYLPPAP